MTTKPQIIYYLYYYKISSDAHDAASLCPHKLYEKINQEYDKKRFAHIASHDKRARSMYPKYGAKTDSEAVGRYRGGGRQYIAIFRIFTSFGVTAHATPSWCNSKAARAAMCDGDQCFCGSCVRTVDGWRNWKTVSRRVCERWRFLALDREIENVLQHTHTTTWAFSWAIYL